MRPDDVYATMPAYSARLVRAMASEILAEQDCVLVSVAGGMQTMRIFALVVPSLFNTCSCETTAKLLRDAWEAHLQFEHEES